MGTRIGRYGKPSYTAQMNGVYENFIIANYGASQGTVVRMRCFYQMSHSDES